MPSSFTNKYVYMWDPRPDYTIKEIEAPFNCGSTFKHVEYPQWRNERTMNQFYYKEIIKYKKPEDPVEHDNWWVNRAEMPKFTKRLSDQELLIDGSVRIEVNITGYPLPEIRWYKDEYPLVEKENITINRYRPESYELHITNATQSDSGIYRCEAKNIAGSSSTSCVVIVRPILRGNYKSTRLRVINSEHKRLHKKRYFY